MEEAEGKGAEKRVALYRELEVRFCGIGRRFVGMPLQCTMLFLPETPLKELRG